MAEILAVSTASGVNTFGHFALQVLKRIRKYNDKEDNIPDILKHIGAQLPLIIDKMTELHIASNAQSSLIQSRSNLATAVASCDEQMERLNNLLDKMLPLETDSRAIRSKKAAHSVYYQKEVTKAWATIEAYKTTFMFHFTPISATVSETNSPTSNDTVSMIPFDRDPHFVGRADILDGIDLAFSTQRRISIAGMGGVG
jgi:N-terminal domain on NACHT_NTPase and P-loop NTPases